MTNEEKIAILEEIMEVEEGILTTETLLSNIEEWDSVSFLSFMAMMDEKFRKTVTGSEIKTKETVGDLMAMME